MKEIQQRVDQMILHLGGYWRPLSGLARLLEEVGEVGAALRSERVGELKEELLDVIVISTCLANQYAIELKTPSKMDVDDSTSQLYFRLVEEAGEVARILNAYEGDKKLKPNKAGLSLQSRIEAVQSAVLSISETNDIHLIDALVPLIEEKTSRDFGRFDHTPDPITEASVRNYLQHRNGRYWGGVEVKPLERISRYVEREQHLKRFMKIAKVEGLEGFVIQQRKDGLITDGDWKSDFQIDDGFDMAVEIYESVRYFVIRPQP